MATKFQYLTFELKRGREAWASFSADLREKTVAALAREGGEMCGLFAPQLGFASNEAVALVRGSPDAQSAFASDAIVHVQKDRLSPTVRPLDGQRLKEGGIYVHRWFTIDGDRMVISSICQTAPGAASKAPMTRRYLDYLPQTKARTTCAWEPGGCFSSPGIAIMAFGKPRANRRATPQVSLPSDTF